MTLSIIMPLYNKKDYVDEAIESCLRQRMLGKMELIIIDDCSSDGSSDKVKKYLGEDVKMIRNEYNMGASASRNIGIRNATGDVIMFMDADDKLMINSLWQRVSVILKCNLRTILISSYDELHNTSASSVVSKHVPSVARTKQEWIKAIAVDQEPYPPLSYMINRELMDAVGLWNESLTYNDDYEYISRLVIRADLVLASDNSAGYYRKDVPGSLGSEMDSIKEYSEYFAHVSVLRSLVAAEEWDNAKQIMQAFERSYVRMYPRQSKLRKAIEKVFIAYHYKPDYESVFRENKYASIIGWRKYRMLKYIASIT